MSATGEFTPEIRTEAAILLRLARGVVAARPGVVDRRLAAIRHAALYAAQTSMLCRDSAKRAGGGLATDAWSRSADRWSAISALLGARDDGFAGLQQ